MNKMHRSIDCSYYSGDLMNHLYEFDQYQTSYQEYKNSAQKCCLLFLIFDNSKSNYYQSKKKPQK